MERDPASRVIIEAMVRLADTYGLRVVAEGVETQEQLAIVRSLGCRFVQGYLFARPMPAAELEAKYGGSSTCKAPLTELRESRRSFSRGLSSVTYRPLQARRSPFPIEAGLGPGISGDSAVLHDPEFSVVPWSAPVQ